MISTASSVYTPRLDAVGRWLSPLALRTLLAWEFFESGREKLGGQNWFDDLEGRFPFPFSALPASLNWQLATWLELVGAACLLLGSVRVRRRQPADIDRGGHLRRALADAMGLAG